METLEIKNTSQELFLEALKTLVLPPKHAEIQLAYKGLDPYSGVKEGMSNKNKCFSLYKKHGVIPVRIDLQYDHNENIFFPEKSSFFFDGKTSSNKIIQAENECIMQGGKIHTLSFEVGNPAKKGLETFLETELVKLLEQKYQFSEVDIVFSYLDKNCVKPDTNLLYLGRDSLGLGIGQGLEIKDALKLSKWFGKLKNKYDK